MLCVACSSTAAFKDVEPSGPDQVPAAMLKRKPLPVETEQTVAKVRGIINSRGVWKERAIERENIIVGVEQHNAAAQARAPGAK